MVLDHAALTERRNLRVALGRASRNIAAPHDCASSSKASFDNVPDATFDYIGHVMADTDFAVEWVMQPMNVRGVSIGKLRDGKVCEQRDYSNGAAFAVPNT